MGRKKGNPNSNADKQSKSSQPQPQSEQQSPRHGGNAAPQSRQEPQASTSKSQPKQQRSVESQQQQPNPEVATKQVNIREAQKLRRDLQKKMQPIEQPDKNPGKKSFDISQLSLSDSAEVSAMPPSELASSEASSPTPIPTTALIPIAPNKGRGTLGQKVMLDVNFLPLIMDNLISTVYQYDVTIEPNLPKRYLPMIFERYRCNNYPDTQIAFDGQKIAVSPIILPINEHIQEKTMIVDENGKDRMYLVKVKQARGSSIDFESLKHYKMMRQYDAPLRALQMLEIVLKSAFLFKSGVQSGRSFYMLPRARKYLDDNYELWTGLYQATVLGSRPYLNVDIAHKAFPSAMAILDILQNMRNVDLRNDIQPFIQRDLTSHLKGLMISYCLPGREISRRCYKFLSLSADSKKFQFKNDEDGLNYNLVDYFRKRGVTIKFPHLPTLKLGNSVRNITVPMEFCSVAEYQVVHKKCSENVTRKMIKEAATNTDIRRQKIMDMLRNIAHNQSPALNEFGINVGDKFTQIEGRVLNPPTLEYFGNRQVVPFRGQWRADKFLFSKTLTRYAVLILDRKVQSHHIRPFCSKISDIGRSLGMNIDQQYTTLSISSDPFSQNFKNELYQKMSEMIQKECELLFCVIPDRGEVYGRVKQCAELECGILTQCLKSSTLLNKGEDQSTVSNILLKVNAKLTGTNHKFASVSRPALLKQPFMAIGADVTHPSPGQENIPSVVGVVASHDIQGFQYRTCWRLQDPKQEMISDFEEIIKDHLTFFQTKHKRLPNVLMYFRDGVSEGQFQQVLTVELNAMYRACQAFPDYTPKITFIVVQKRHHTRFFPPPGSGLGKNDPRNNNVPPGTVVDNEITHPNECQFYLVSHQSIQGVAKPTKYCVLKDDSDYSMDELQTLTYNLCHFFARCTRTVSYPAPTYYAHLAAARGRVYIEGQHLDMGNLQMEFERRKEKMSGSHPMYFI